METWKEGRGDACSDCSWGQITGLTPERSRPALSTRGRAGSRAAWLTVGACLQEDTNGSVSPPRCFISPCLQHFAILHFATSAQSSCNTHQVQERSRSTTQGLLVAFVALPCQRGPALMTASMAQARHSPWDHILPWGLVLSRPAQSKERQSRGLGWHRVTPPRTAA